MHLATPPSRLRRGVRRFALTICALILGAGFTPALPSTMEPAPSPAVSFAASAAPAPSAPRSTVEEPAPEPVLAAAAPMLDGAVAVPAGRPPGAVAGRAPPANSA
ncbi:hypothetical protein [Dactylosporangium sp. CA-139066]|uniref:hypothetical protein n=1 Tax=Dactylosporangium sp. CA-139066 TaxID=3239930 RepID=UPI003D901AC2